MSEIILGRRTIREDSPPYVIAEIGVNHEGSLVLAKRLIEQAAEGGADCAKFQSYKAETLASRNSPAYWDTEKEPTTSQFDLFKKYDRFGPEEYCQLANHCERVGIDFISTPFDMDAVTFLAPLVPFFKIASADLTNIPLLRRIAQEGKPVILSTGAATLAEIDTAVHELDSFGCPSLALLHCVLNYPTPDELANLGMIKGLSRCYPQFVIGYSDHTVPCESMQVLTTAYLLGARIIEKHFTHDKTLPGNDHYHAMDTTDLIRFRESIDRHRRLIGQEFKQPLASEQLSREHARRSIVTATAIRCGEALAPETLTAKRPAHGISPLFWDEVVGKTATRDLPDDHVLAWNDFD